MIDKLRGERREDGLKGDDILKMVIQLADRDYH